MSPRTEQESDRVDHTEAEDRASVAQGELAPPERILFVCTGNVCRSPFLELVFRARVARLGLNRITLSSAGTAALINHPIAQPMAAILDERGIDSTAFRASSLRRGDIEVADLIVTAGIEHRAAVSRLHPAARDRTFTALQIRRLAPVLPDGGAPDAPLRSLARRLAAARGTLGGPSRAEADDLPDPWGRSAHSYRVSAGRMDDALKALFTLLR